MEVRHLLDRWSQESRQRDRLRTIQLRLDAVTVAQLRALEDMYPGHSLGHIANDLLRAALAELEATLPYEPGPRILREDEFGDPVYEDIGPTPRFLALTQQYLKTLDQQEEADPPA
ncbi:hypothetical protein BI364_08240 [Acidihalobacter yilgarnensis]|uniref:Type 1 pili tip component n=1 Tax=Acidihalobacter yilgarnensis TaxID=2819280 RepID=A0A1D8INB2_9GAMM|nr:hypothetical protein [Acidihalobacter yilgarnensis]AOU97952.1 hypothetical protein BI364_08240 [Acidihalobacter yilgarnensis]